MQHSYEDLTYFQYDGRAVRPIVEWEYHIEQADREHGPILDNDRFYKAVVADVENAYLRGVSYGIHASGTPTVTEEEVVEQTRSYLEEDEAFRSFAQRLPRDIAKGLAIGTTGGTAVAAAAQLPLSAQVLYMGAAMTGLSVADAVRQRHQDPVENIMDDLTVTMTEAEHGGKEVLVEYNVSSPVADWLPPERDYDEPL